MSSKFKIIICSDIEYDDLCAEIYFEDQFVAIVSQEKGYENLEIEIAPPHDTKSWSFKLSEFQDILMSAKEALWKMRKMD